MSIRHTHLHSAMVKSAQFHALLRRQITRQAPSEELVPVPRAECAACTARATWVRSKEAGLRKSPIRLFTDVYQLYSYTKKGARRSLPFVLSPSCRRLSEKFAVYTNININIYIQRKSLGRACVVWRSGRNTPVGHSAASGGHSQRNLVAGA